MKRATKPWIIAPLLLLLLGATASLWAGMDQPAPQTHTVTIYEYGEGSYRVYPGTLPVNNGDKVIFNNVTPLPVQIWIPERSLLGESGAVRGLGPGEKAQESDAPVIQSYEKARGTFPYQVLLGGTIKDGIVTSSYFAIGDSPPRMIVQ